MEKKSRILLSAYACEPNTGSEPEIGWGWAKNLASLGHEVSVITRETNREKIEAALIQNPELKINFYYYDLSKKILKIIKGKSTKPPYTLTFYYYCIIWQFGIYPLAKSIIKERNIDIIHHVTVGSLRYPSFLGFLKIPLIFGPVGGGEKIPNNLKKSFSFSSKIKEFIRELSTNYIKISPLMNLTFSSSNKIYVATEDTKKSIPKRYHHKTKLLFATGIDDKLIIDPKFDIENSNKKLRLIFVGRLIYWKGLHIVLKSFSKIKETIKNQNIELLIRGNGPLEQKLKELAKKLDIQDNVKWLDRLEEFELFNLYKKSDLLIFPSLHDSGGMVILEAMANGLPTATLNLGGPGVIVNNECGVSIEVKNKTENQVIEDLSNSIVNIINDKEKLFNLKKNCLRRIKQFTWKEKIRKIYE